MENSLSLPMTKVYILNSLMKLSTRVASKESVDKIKSTLLKYKSNCDPELQQRSVEYEVLFNKYDHMRYAIYYVCMYYYRILSVYVLLVLQDIICVCILCSHIYCYGYGFTMVIFRNVWKGEMKCFKFSMKGLLIESLANMVLISNSSYLLNTK